MTSNTNSSRVTAEQLTQMKNFMQENSDLVEGECDKKWIELVGVLNSLGGAVKSVEEWQTVWRDFKSRTNMKESKPTSQEPFTDLEKRVIALIGSDYSDEDESDVENVSVDEELLEGGDDDFSRSPKRGLKRKYKENVADTQAKFLEIANQQAESLKILADSNAEFAETNKMMAEAIKTMGEGLSAVGNAFNNLANAINQMK